VLTLWLLIFPSLLPMPEGAEGLDVNVTVAVGPHSVLPRMPLEMAPADPGVASDFHRARLVKGYGELRVLSTDLGLHFASMFFFLVGLLTVLYAVWTLRKVLQSVLAREPFASPPMAFSSGCCSWCSRRSSVTAPSSRRSALLPSRTRYS
jgi:hypothetical protein